MVENNQIVKARILVVEDEPKTARSIQKGLEESDYEVEVAYDGEAAIKLIDSRNYDLCLLDYILPKQTGLKVCEFIRSKHIKTPVLFLTALDTTEDKVTVLEAGADDYLVKPFEFRELLARVNSLLRRAKGDWNVVSVLTYEDLELNLNTRMAKRGDKIIELTAREFTLLEWLMRNKERVISKPEIEKNVWNINYDTSSNVVEVYMNFLRKKIDREFEHKLIHTQIGQGYILKSVK